MKPLPKYSGNIVIKPIPAPETHAQRKYPDEQAGCPRFRNPGKLQDFRARERNFSASPVAVAEAKTLGLVPGPGSAVDYWRVRAEMFLDTFERYFQWKKPGSSMDM